tara:strand:+ start:481 stop:783 length:303 start_codon:yes stop_codon:yes gene_type:complete
MVQGDCSCNGTVCKEGFGWIWKTADLALNAHRGDMWAEPCEHYPPENMVEIEGVGKIPPAPEGLPMKHLLTYLKNRKGARRAQGGWHSSELAMEGKRWNQ